MRLSCFRKRKTPRDQRLDLLLFEQIKQGDQVLTMPVSAASASGCCMESPVFGPREPGPRQCTIQTRRFHENADDDLDDPMGAHSEDDRYTQVLPVCCSVSVKRSLSRPLAP